MWHFVSDEKLSQLQFYHPTISKYMAILESASRLSSHDSTKIFCDHNWLINIHKAPKYLPRFLLPLELNRA